MKRLTTFLSAMTLGLVLSGCWVGDTDDPEILYDTTVIEELCQTPEISLFCEMCYLTKLLPNGPSPNRVPEVAWQLMFAGRSGNIGPGGEACPEGVETVFAPSNEAILEFLEDFPQWPTIYDIPKDSLGMILKHHIYLDGKIMRQNATPECTEVPFAFGSQQVYNMWFGNWIFAQGQQDLIGIVSLNSFDQSLAGIESPDLSSSDGVVYIIQDVLSPFDR